MLGHDSIFYFRKDDPNIYKQPCGSSDFARKKDIMSVSHAARLPSGLQKKVYVTGSPSKKNIEYFQQPVQRKRDYVIYSPSKKIIEYFQREFNKAIGPWFFGWMSGLTLSKEEASCSVEEAIDGALTGLADNLREKLQVGEHVKIDNVFHDMLVNGIAIRLGRLALSKASEIAECVLTELVETLQTSQLQVDGANVYVKDGVLFMCLTLPVSLNDIIDNSDDWEMRPVKL